MEVLGSKDSSRIDGNIFGEALVSCMESSDPICVGRIGGTEFDILANYVKNPNGVAAWGSNHQHPLIQNIKLMAGYFCEDETAENLVRYLERQKSSLLDSDLCTYGNYNLINFIAEAIKADGPVAASWRSIDEEPNQVGYAALMSALEAMPLRAPIVNFSFIEALDPFMHSFSSFAEGKTILIVSPFPDSYRRQYERKDELFEGYKFPRFNLKTFRTPITWNQNYESLAGAVEYMDWHGLIDDLCSSIYDCGDFDIALVSCASYAMPICSFIKTELKRKAIYMGGPLQPMFNIDAGRYRAYGTPFYLRRKKESSTPVLEQDEYSWLVSSHAGRFRYDDAYGAYFTPKV